MNQHNDTQTKVKVPPYNTGKLVIGSQYIHYEPVKMSEEDEFWQGVLLNRPAFTTGATKRFWLFYSTVMCLLVLAVSGVAK